jgi:hypothetical protein
MNNALLGFTIAILAGVAPATLHGQKAYVPARLSDGQPDIQGYWGNAPGGPDSVNVETGLQTADSLRVQGWTDARIAARVPVSSIIDTPDKKIPFQPWARARRDQILSRYGGDEATGKPETVRDLSSELLCVIGAPRIVVFAEFHLVQTPGYVVMQWERSGDFRIIPIGDRPHLAEPIKLHNGDSRGRWDGNTLVVDTANINDWGWFDSKGALHSDAMTMVERFTPIDANTIDYKVTVTDPKTFTQPWTMEFELARRHAGDAHYEIYETACVEGERALDRLLPGVKR